MIHQKILEALSVLTAEEEEILSGKDMIDRNLYMKGTPDVVNGDKLLERGRNLTIRPHTRFIDFPEHSHDYVEMVYMCQGTTYHLVNGSPIELKQGELLMLGQNARQQIKAAGKDDIAVNFIVRPQFLAGVLDFVGEEESPLRRFVLDCLCGGNEVGYLYFKVADVLPVQNLIENLLWTLIRYTPNERGILQTTMGLLFAQLLGYTDSLEFAYQEQKAIVAVLGYIESHYSNGSLTEIADMIPYDFTALSRLIKKETGKTYTELVQEKRLSQAAWMLTNTNSKVNDIALAVGYENISYFHRIFAARFGMSPRRYRICK